MIPNPCIEVQTSPLDRSSVPEWFAEVVMIARHLATKGLLEAFAQQVRLVRGRFGSYEPIDFLALLVGYAISLSLVGFFGTRPEKRCRSVGAGVGLSGVGTLASPASYSCPDMPLTPGRRSRPYRIPRHLFSFQNTYQ